MISVPTHASRKAVTRLPAAVDQVIAAPLMNAVPPGGRKYEGVADRRGSGTGERPAPHGPRMYWDHAAGALKPLFDFRS